MGYNYPLHQTWKKVSDFGVSFLEVADVKSHMNVTTTADDTLIGFYIDCATEVIENVLGQILMSTNMELYLDKFPRSTIVMPAPPLQTVSAVQYMDDDGNYQTVDVANYQIDIVSWPGRVAPVPEYTWPSTPARLNAVKLTYLAGYGVAGTNVPEDIRQAGRHLIAHWYEHREAVSDDVKLMSTPATLELFLGTQAIGETF